VSASIVDGAIVNADINASAAIAKTKLASLDIVNADVNASAAIVQSKLATLAITDSEVADNALSGNKIDGGTISNFASTGIDDNAAATAITIDGSQNVSVPQKIFVGGATTSIPVSNGQQNWVQQHETYNRGGTTWFSTHNSASGAESVFAKGRSGSIGSYTIVADNDRLGTITFCADDGTDMNSVGAQIWSAVDGTPGENDMPCQLSFATTADGSASPTERMRILPSGRIEMGPNLYNYGGILNVSGHHNSLRSIHSEGYATTTGSEPVFFNETNASFASYVLRLSVNHAAATSFGFIQCWSANGGDVEFSLRGDGNAYADASWNNSGADYAEFFESATGEPIPVGTTVVLDDNKVRAATAEDSASLIMGVSRPKVPSKASMIIGNTAWNMWHNKYLTDDFDQYIMEDYTVTAWKEDNADGVEIEKSFETDKIPAGETVPEDAVITTERLVKDKMVPYKRRKQNPDWDESVEYIPREDRDEWIVVGMLGQIPIIKGQPINSSWIKMRDISASVEEWLVK
jgi:hypothetical protein